MEFIDQKIEIPKKASLMDLNESYREISIKALLLQQKGMDISNLSEAALGKKELLEKEREALEEEKKALEENKKLFQAKFEAFEKLFQDENKSIEAWKQEASQYFSEVVFKIAEAALREELSLKPERLKDLILNLVQKTYEESERKLLLNPNNLHWMNENFPSFISDLESKHQILVREDEAIPEHTFILDTSLHQYQENPFLNIEWLKKELYPTP